MAILKTNLIARWYRCFRNRKDFGRFNYVVPGTVSEMKTVPHNIDTPSYYVTAVPTPGPSTVEIKTADQINGMIRSCQLARSIMNTVGEEIKVGMTTDELDTLVHELCIKNGAYPSPLNYKKYPKSICTSVNNIACHGIPDDRRLHDGDIINVDITVYYKGYHGDCSNMFLLGNVDKKGRRLVQVCREALDQAIRVCKPGVPINMIGLTTQTVALRNGFQVVPVYVGHGIGSYFHGPPDVYHFYDKDYKEKMKPGMTFTIEPILSQGSRDVNILKDGWTATSVDGSRSAQWEETVLITESGVEVLTKKL